MWDIAVRWTHARNMKEISQSLPIRFCACIICKCPDKTFTGAGSLRLQEFAMPWSHHYKCRKFASAGFDNAPVTLLQVQEFCKCRISPCLGHAYTGARSLAPINWRRFEAQTREKKGAKIRLTTSTTPRPTANDICICIRRPMANDICPFHPANDICPFDPISKKW